MLAVGWREEAEARIVLESKRRDEFMLVLRHIDTIGGRTPPEINASSVDVLLRWADEYQIEALRDRCEAFLQENSPADLDGLCRALRYGLSGWRERCLEALAEDMPRYKADLRTYVSDPSVMEALWPVLHAAAGLVPRDAATYGFDEAASDGSLHAVWPFVEAAIEAPLAKSAAVVAATAAEVFARNAGVRHSDENKVPRHFFAGALCGATALFIAYGAVRSLRGEVNFVSVPWLAEYVVGDSALLGLWLGAVVEVFLAICYFTYLALTDPKYAEFGDNYQELVICGCFIGWVLVAPGVFGGHLFGMLCGTPVWCCALMFAALWASVLHWSRHDHAWPFPPLWALFALCLLPAVGAWHVEGLWHMSSSGITTVV